MTLGTTPTSMYRAAHVAQNDVMARRVTHAISLLVDDSITCARLLYRSRIEQSRPAYPRSHVQRLCAHLPWPEQPRAQPSVPSASSSHPAPSKPTWQTQRSGEWPGLPVDRHTPCPEHVWPVIIT